MLFNFALVSVFLLASAVLADRRREGRQSRFINRVKQSTHAASSEIEYTSNWSGAVWEEGDETFTFVTGTFTVPVPSGNSGTVASAWVGIDGDTCNSAGLLQTGVDFTVTDDGGASYGAWYEWYPDWSYYFSDLEISAGDTIKATVTAYSWTSGNATIENLTNGQSGSQQLNSTYRLCGRNAEWIVEDYSDYNNNTLPLANFDSVTFTDAKAAGTGTYTPDGAKIMNIQQNDQVLTSVLINGSSVTIQYV